MQPGRSVLLRVLVGSLCVATVAYGDPAADVQLGSSGGPIGDAPDDDAVAAPAPADELVEDAIETTSLTDDLLGGTRLRPIKGTRAEALMSTGSYGTHRALARATARRGGVGLELDADWLASRGYNPIAPRDRGAVDGDATIDRRDAGARVEHTRGGSHARAYGRYVDERREAGTEHQNTNMRVARYGGRWTVTRPAVRLDLESFGEVQRLREIRPRVTLDRASALTASRHAMPWTVQGVRGSLTSRPLLLFGAHHELTAGVGMVRASADLTDELRIDEMRVDKSLTSRRVHGDHRFLGAYIEDTVRLIRSLDVSGGLVIERWQNLGGATTFEYGPDGLMDAEIPDVTSLLVSPSLGALYRVNDELALRARTSRGFRAPTMNELYRSSLLGDTLTAANPELRPERVWTTEIGPQITAGRIQARATAFYSEVDDVIESVTTAAPLADGAIRQRHNVGRARVVGLDTQASWRPAKAWLATVSYTFAASRVTESELYPDLVAKHLAQAPRQRASALLTFDAPEIATLTGGVRYVDRQFEDDLNSDLLGGYTIVDAVAARRLASGISGFVAVDNLLDRRYLIGRTGIDTLGAPRMFHVGLRVDSKRF
jgi:iron complex outermembrane recepter protein